MMITVMDDGWLNYCTIAMFIDVLLNPLLAFILFTCILDLQLFFQDLKPLNIFYIKKKKLELFLFYLKPKPEI